ncbi:SAM-dependent methyltransferase [Streptomonospora salina]|uniref:Uncharacterized protein n=1 Tax=Streptomonospora salina TaxID=104205 RepID=A0A841ED31_9ACTN|nr:SAM-dependent methyltransferase [Streptomonospora salina]MBB5998370.1 hypothetical protein [Streptomonospora salina]
MASTPGLRASARPCAATIRGTARRDIPADIAAFFDGPAPVEPGIVSADLWRPDDRIEAGSDARAHIHTGVARKVQ